MTKIEKLRAKTEKESLAMLEKYGKCAIIRPTGFGKTCMLSKLLNSYKKVIYLYPNDIIRRTVIKFHNKLMNTNNKNIENTMFITYSKLLNLNKADYDTFQDVDLIIADECHKLGANKTGRAMLKLIEALPNAKLLGATATPERMDLIDQIDIFFDNHVVSKYTLHDAFQDEILQKPYYCFCSYASDEVDDWQKAIRLEVDKSSNLKDRQDMESMLKSRLVEISNIRKMHNVIKTTCDDYADDTNNMKFIIFCSSFNHLHESKDRVISWFKDAYPDYKIDDLIVTSEKKVYHDNLSKVDDDPNTNKHIKLIFTCDMLNMGYHVDDITGIMMYRGTESSIIFVQQLGRTLSSGDMKPKIVFDVVDNIHRTSVYAMLEYESRAKTRKEKLIIREKKKLIEKLEKSKTDKTIVFTEDDKKQLDALESLDSKKWWTSANTIEPTDLTATKHMATYRELIAKTVAEPISMRCRQAWARWIEKGGDPRDMKMASILHQKEPDAVPLAPFCRMKQVSINQVLDTMNVKND